MTESTVTPFEDWLHRSVVERDEALEAINNNFAKALAGRAVANPASLRPFLGGNMRSALLVVLCAALLSGCTSASQTSNVASTSGAPDSTDAPEPGGITASQKADKFVYFGEGVVARWTTPAEEASSECASYAASCYSVAVQTNLSCPGGVYIELALLNSTESIIGKANEITPAMYPEDKGVFPISTATKAPKAKFAKVECLG
ncbi:hypothetical protein AB0N24_04560 [Arthrobacter sp. NPDC093128]|uniref:hypothetical protein n=1 Tax=Arthrobacter sp. NPDC093128 TaxID=3154979 RepID=UPI0034419E76